jgi:TonB-dependent SusC/RagA subfamily outer membrane receptor
MPTRIPFLVLIVLVTGCSAHLRPAVPSGPTAPPAQPQIAATDPVPLFFLDGEEIRAADLKMIDSASIASIDRLIGPTAISLYGVRAGAGVIHIATKAAPRRTTPTTLLFLLDGREIPAGLVRVLDTKRINSVEVLKGAAALAYGNRAHGGVVLITSKAG